MPYFTLLLSGKDACYSNSKFVISLKEEVKGEQVSSKESEFVEERVLLIRSWEDRQRIIEAAKEKG
jgi:hypothetical protein